ncbi:hypothetical protein [Streptomyces sp. NPDC098781]|uniref:hypothetical protein n=1 Tax=Streptomyces sp. NPDC098781 TaxID=3366097 RepID=UPI0037FBB59F
MLTSACGGEAPQGGGEARETPVVQSDGPVGTDTTASGRKDQAGELKTTVDPKVGPILTDAAGFSLYRFTKDSATPPKSACDGECTKLWPPVPAKGASLPKGLDKALLGTLTRPDGVAQLTLAGIPLYRYSKDTKPGEVKGEGVGGTWFASPPEEGIPALMVGPQGDSSSGMNRD